MPSKLKGKMAEDAMATTIAWGPAPRGAASGGKPNPTGDADRQDHQEQTDHQRFGLPPIAEVTGVVTFVTTFGRLRTSTAGAAKMFYSQRITTKCYRRPCISTPVSSVEVLDVRAPARNCLR